MKRHFRELNVESTTETLINSVDESEINYTESSLNAIKGGKRKRLSILNNQKQEFSKSDLNTVGFDVSY